MTATNGKVGTFVREHLSRVLREVGFKQKSLAWNRNAAGFVDVVDIQPSRWNDSKDEKFTMNFGVHSPGGL